MITAKLSREFYERFGDKVVNEMVDLFNRIDDAARSDLRLLNEQNALRFEARLSQQTAEMNARFDGVNARFDGVNARFDAVNAAVNARFDSVIDAVNARFDGVNDGVNTRFDGVNDGVNTRFDAVNARLDSLETRLEKIEGAVTALRDELNKALLVQTRWMIGAWGILLASQVALWFR